MRRLSPFHTLSHCQRKPRTCCSPVATAANESNQEAIKDERERLIFPRIWAYFEGGEGDSRTLASPLAQISLLPAVCAPLSRDENLLNESAGTKVRWFRNLYRNGMQRNSVARKDTFRICFSNSLRGWINSVQ